MELIFFGFIGVVIAVLIVSGYRRAGRGRSHPHDGGVSSWMFWHGGDSTSHPPQQSHGSHDHGHSHHSGCDHGGHDSGGCSDSGGGGDGGGGGSSD